MEAQNESAKIIKTVNNGYRAEMWYCDDKETRERQVEDNTFPQDAPVKIVLTHEDDGLDGTVREERFAGDEQICSRIIGQPRISELVKSRSWWTPKDEEDG